MVASWETMSGRSVCLSVGWFLLTLCYSNGPEMTVVGFIPFHTSRLWLIIGIHRSLLIMVIHGQKTFEKLSKPVIIK